MPPLRRCRRGGILLFRFDEPSNKVYHPSLVIGIKTFDIDQVERLQKQSMGPANLPHVLIISHDVVGSRMAGPGIRYWEIAHVLASQQPVTLLAPQPIDLQAPFRCGSYAWGAAGALNEWLAQADLVVANGFVLHGHPELAHTEHLLVLDLYDPILLENLELFRTSSLQERSARYEHDRAMLAQQLLSGDFFLCATERQRDLYSGALMALGCITPARVDVDPLLRQLIDVVPFGLPSNPPIKCQAALRGVLSGISADDIVLLWTGGLWDWMDPLTLIRAMPHVVAAYPHVRLVFLAGQHPGTTVEMRAPKEARELAATLGMLDRQIFFYDQWVPYQQRADFLLEADLAVSLHRNHLETSYAAVRSRFLDHLWAGLPSIVTDGDAAADLVLQHKLGRVVAAEDVDGVARALIALIGDEVEHQACRERVRAIADNWTWERAVEPLLHFCRRPLMEKKSRPASEPTVEQPDRHAARNNALDRLDQIWKVQPQELTSQLPLLGQTKQLANTLTRWYVQPIVEQQNAFNAAVVHALQRLAETGDQYHTDISAVKIELAQTTHELARVSNVVSGNFQHLMHGLNQALGQIANITAHLQSLQRQVDGIAAHLEKLARESAPLHQHIADIELHLCDIDDAQTAMAQQLAAATVETERPV